MAKLLLLSLLISMMMIPARAAREVSPSKGLRKVIIQTMLFNVFYAFALIFLYGRLNN